MTIDLDRNPWPTAAAFMEKVGFTKGAERDGEGHVCAEGAVRYCTPQQGDGVIWREVLVHRGKGAQFNDAEDTTMADVLGYFRTAPEITDRELETVYGPQWVHVVALIRRAAALTDDEKRRYYDAVGSAWNKKDWTPAWRAVFVLSGPGYAARRALVAVGLDGYYARVAAALARRHEVSTAHYDTLTRPWRTVIGPIHPDDPEVEG